MKSYPQGRDVAGSIIVVLTTTVDTAAGELAAFDIRDAGLEAMCPWLAKALTQGNPDSPTEEQITDAETAFAARAILRSVEAVLVTGPAVVLAYVADTDGEALVPRGSAYVKASGDVPVRGLNWPNIAEEHLFYWGTNGEGEATVELTIGMDVMPDPDGPSARLLRS